MKILYIGNKLSKFGTIPTSVETLGLKLSEFYKVITISDKKNKLFRISEMVISIIKSRDVDYVIIDTYSGLAFIYCLVSAMICRIVGKKYIPILRGGDLPNYLRGKKNLSFEIFDYATINVSPSLFIKYQLSILGIKSVCIQNTIDIKNYNFKHRLKCQPKLLWVRSFHNVYNPEMAIYVLLELLKKYPESKLCMIGPEKDGSMKNCKSIAEKYNISEKVEFVGFLPKDQWIDLSSRYDIFINTTDFDNQPVSVIEAMALGFPIVSTNVGGLQYLHNDGVDALMVEKNDIEGMSDAVERIISDDTLANRLSKNARKKAQKFDWDIVKYLWQELLTVR